MPLKMSAFPKKKTTWQFCDRDLFGMVIRDPEKKWLYCYISDLQQTRVIKFGHGGLNHLVGTVPAFEDSGFPPSSSSEKPRVFQETVQEKVKMGLGTWPRSNFAALWAPRVGIIHKFS